MQIYTIGYGNRSIGDFLDLLRHYGVQVLVDTRSVPYSRFRPDYRKNAFQAHLAQAGFDYRYLGDVLGGKKVDPDCLRADGSIDLECLYGKESFQQGLAQVEDIVRQGQTPALMCAELRPEDCHRVWMLSPPLAARGYSVLHIDAVGGLKVI